MTVPTLWFLVVSALFPGGDKANRIPTPYLSESACWGAAEKWAPALSYKEVEGPNPAGAGRYAILCLPGRLVEVR